ncbi:MAG: condensation domain-containing protein, partial [Phormidesmis sp.]
LARRSSENAATTDTTPLNTLRLELEGHGREQIAPNVDLSRTVGWFTTTYPVSLQISEAADLGESIKSIKEQLRQIPNRGIGYGLLRYSADEKIQAQLKAFAPAEILFNYLGQQQQQPNREKDTQLGNVRSLLDIDLGTLRSPDNPRSHPLEINAWIANGQLTLKWTYDAECYQPSVITNVAHRYLDTLKALIAHCTAHCATRYISGERSGYTPSDFPDLDLDQAQLNRFVEHLPGQIQNNIEAIYPLAPLQTAFLWNSLQTSAQAGLLHMRGTLHGQLDLDRLQQAWQQIVSRHAALRTSVHWEATQNPLQVVSKQIDTPWQQLDWQAYAPHEIAERLTKFLERDRTLGFDLTQAPLNRIALIRTGDRTHELIWTCHHLMLDGWSGTLVINQLLTQYEALTQQAPPSETQIETQNAATYQTSTYQTYVRWRSQQDAMAAQSFWKTYLKSFTTPTLLSAQPSDLDSHPSTLGSQSSALDPSALNTASTQIDRPISAFLRAHRLTFNTLIQATWSLLLHCRSGQLDTLFGATVSGRQADLPNVESIVGMLINVLPVRVKITPKATVLSWLQALQNQQATASRYAYASPSQIQAWSECPTQLFNSLLVIENYPTQQDTQQNKEQSLKIENLRSGIVSTYGLTLIVRPGDQPTLCAESKNIECDRLQTLLADFTSLLNKIVDSPAQPLQQILPPAQEMSALRAAQSQPPQPSPASSVTVDTPPTQLPRNSIELELIKIWESVLGIPALTPEDSFFDLGGSSLLAVQLFDQMQQQLNCTLPLATLFQAPTIRQFATVLTQDQPVTDWSSLVPIQPNGTRTPLFFHGGSADALTWARFATLLGSDQPFYALQRPDLDGGEILHDTIESLASACIQEIKMVQPQGPYAIGGHCFGGAVAFEIARQLKAQGDAIATLIEIDAYCPNAVSHTPIGHLQESLQRAHFNLRKAYYYHGGQNLAQLLPKIQQKIKNRLFPQPDVASSPVASSPTDLSEASPIATPGKVEKSQSSYQDRYARAHQASEAASQQY